MKITSKPVLLVCNLSLLLATLPGCTRAHYTPPSAQAGATQSASSSALNGYWVEESVPQGQLSPRGHALKTTSIFFQDGKLFNLVKYSDGTIDQLDAQLSVPSSADANGNFVVTGDGLVETFHDNGNKLAISDLQTHGDIKTTTNIVYVQADQTTASQHARPLWFKKKSDYAFAKQFCSIANKLDPSSSATLNQINQFVTNDLTNKNTTLDKIRTQRNAAGSTFNNCQIAEDYLERGLLYAQTGVTPVYPEFAERPSLSISVDSKSSLSPLLALQLDSLTLNSDDGGKSIIDLSQLTQITGLESLTLNGVQVTGFEKLSSLSLLTDLTLIGTDLPNYSVLKQLPALQGLNLANSTIAQSLGTISKLSQLDLLALNSWSKSPQKIDISSIGDLSNLLTLAVSNDFFTRLDFLPSLGKLLSLDVYLADDTYVNMISSLSTVSSLKNITIEKTIKNTDDMKFISAMPNIVALVLTLNSDFNDLSAINSKTTPRLQLLSLDGSGSNMKQSLPDLTNILKISGLSRLSFIDFSISDLSVFEGFLKTGQYNTVSLGGDEISSTQKSMDQKLQQEFGIHYDSSESTFK